MSNPLIVAVAGGSGSGKTTFVNLLVEKCQSQALLVFHLDHYYKDWSHLAPEERKNINFDDPETIDVHLLTQHLRQLAAGHSVERPTYDFSTHTRTGELVTLNPAPVILFDGIFALHYSAIQNLLGLRLFIDVDSDIRLMRRLKRDIAERGRSMEAVLEQYLKTVKPMHDQFVEPSKSNADFVVRWHERNEQAITHVLSLIKESLSEQDS